MGLDPELARDANRVDALVAHHLASLPARCSFAMMATAERHGEFVADLEAETSGLRKPQMMGIAGLPGTDQAGLPGDKAEVGLVAVAAQLGKGQHALVDSVRFDHCRRFLDLQPTGAASSGEGANSRVAASAPRLAMSRSLA